MVLDYLAITHIILLVSHSRLQGRVAAELTVDWNGDPSLPEVANYPFYEPMTIQIRDSDGLVVESGPDSNLSLFVTAHRASNTSIPVCVGDYISLTR